MKVTYIGHASILVEAGGLRILSDPWWRGPCFGAQWWTYPLPDFAAVGAGPIDYIYVSHGHHDHFHPGTLSTFNKGVKILASAELKLAPSIRQLGFEVIEIGERELFELRNGVSCRIMQTHGGDSLMAVSDGAEVCLNLNDSLHSAPQSVQKNFIAQLKALYPKIDYAFCGYGTASHFPNCYIVPGKNREATAAQRQRYFNREWARIMDELRPAYAFPFAADVVFLEDDLFWSNEVTHNAERPTQAFQALYPDSTAIVKDIAPGFAIENGIVTVDAPRQPLVAADLKRDCAQQIERANRHGSVKTETLNDIVKLLKENLATCANYLGSHERDYRFLLRFHNSNAGIRIEKRGRQLDIAPTQTLASQGYDLAYTTRLPYMKLALTQPFGHEVLLVGSGGVFEYFQRDSAAMNLHRELIALIKKTRALPRTRQTALSKSIGSAKRMVKRALGLMEPDLYDLNTWTVYSDKEERKETLSSARVSAVRPIDTFLS